MTRLDTQQIEQVGRAVIETRLIHAGWEVARPACDRGIDVIAYSEQPVFQARPIQLKAFTDVGISLESKYQGRGIYMAYIWRVLDPEPRLFVLPYEAVLDVVPPSALETVSWTRDGKWYSGAPSRAVCDRLGEYEGVALT